MDSFEVASQFTTILRNLTPQYQQLTKATYFALKNADKEDYIVPTILTVIEDPKLDLNTKSTIFQFIELLIAESFQNQTKFNNAYLESLKTALPQIIENICPKENSANFQNAYQSLSNISRHFNIDCREYQVNFQQVSLTKEDMTILDQEGGENASCALKLQENGENVPGPSKFQENGENVSCPSKFQILDTDDSLVSAWKTLLEKKRHTQIERYKLLKRCEFVDENVTEDQLFSMRDKSDMTKPHLLTKRQIISRMEDERESHKRSKENIWCVNRDRNTKFISEDEFVEYYWDRYHKLNRKDYNEFLNNLQDLNIMALKSYKDEQFV
ncbi:hypothetical protein KGF56_002833 [Candida oxycetoniae]|uniref:CID domain-containing protein n=1 Tax=Candida oxycetoniae TaxID=497107 RepID=A0AAI9SWD6_9ASCO|nr:uncharacterized protein KGF56_002833 [Candida oxycetoniae]KAI3404313.2 hypothetical protein KGF56_002833 [Candida oxycetoniae]